MSLHERILQDIEQRILSGMWPPGHRIPSEHELTETYACSRMTVNKVLSQLARAGLVERRRKAGTFVMRQQSRSAVLEIHDIRMEVAALGQSYRYEVLSSKKRRSNRLDMDRLGLTAVQSVLDIATLHYAAERPFCLEERLINLEAVPAAAEEDFSMESPGPWLVHHVPWTSAEHRIRAEGAPEHVATLLNIESQTPCLLVQRRTWIGNLPVTSVRLHYPGDGHELTARFSPSTSDGQEKPMTSKPRWSSTSAVKAARP